MLLNKSIPIATYIVIHFFVLCEGTDVTKVFSKFGEKKKCSLDLSGNNTTTRLADDSNNSTRSSIDGQLNSTTNLNTTDLLSNAYVSKGHEVPSEQIVSKDEGTSCNDYHELCSYWASAKEVRKQNLITINR